MPLFVSNTLMRAVKLSNSLPLPSSPNNGTYNLPVLNDINQGGGENKCPGECMFTHKDGQNLTLNAEGKGKH